MMADELIPTEALISVALWWVWQISVPCARVIRQLESLMMEVARQNKLQQLPPTKLVTFSTWIMIIVGNGVGMLGDGISSEGG